MSFTSALKKEIISRGIGGENALAEKKSGLSAFIRTSGTLGVKDGEPKFFIVSETENVAEFFTTLFSEVFDAELAVTNATIDRMSRRDKLLLQCPRLDNGYVLKELWLLRRSGEGFKEGISSGVIATERQKIAYVQGAFLGGGSCTLPGERGKTGYHLEIVFFERKTARDFCALLSEFELLVKLIERKETFVVYIKSKEMISDFLSLVGAEHCLKKFSALVEKRDEANQSNRTQNCMAGNADKAAMAAVKQVFAIRKLQETGAYEELSAELKELAELRLLQPSMSLQELADRLKISKSCLNHRMRKLTELANKE